MMQDIAKIINRFYKRNSNGKLVATPEHKLFTSVEHTKTGYQDEWHEGVIWDVACVKVGGFPNLQDAVHGRRVKTSGTGDWKDLQYNFPRSSVGAREMAAKAIKGQTTHDVTDDGMKSFSLALEDMIPTMGTILKDHDGGCTALQFNAQMSRPEIADTETGVRSQHIVPKGKAIPSNGNPVQRHRTNTSNASTFQMSPCPNV